MLVCLLWASERRQKEQLIHMNISIGVRNNKSKVKWFLQALLWIHKEPPKDTLVEMFLF